MPKFLSRIPFWVWPVVGVACIIMSIPGFLAWLDTSARQEALAEEIPELVDLGEFDPAAHAGVAGEVHVFAQTNPTYAFVIDSTGIFTKQRYMVPLFSAAADEDERNVHTVVLTENADAFRSWLSENVAGNAQLGDLYAINGRLTDGQGFTAAIKVTLRDAGLNQAETITVIDPFVGGRVAALEGKAVARFGNPLILLVGGLYLCGIGWLIWHRSRKVERGVDTRLSALKPSPSIDPEEPRSNMPENVKVLPDAATRNSPKGAKPARDAEASGKDTVTPIDRASATPAE